MAKIKTKKVMLINMVKYKGEYLSPGKVIEMEEDIVKKLMQDGAVEYYVERPKQEVEISNAGNNNVSEKK